MPKSKSDQNVGIVATSQQSRFHTETIEAPVSKDIDLKDVSVAVGGVELLNHAHLQIHERVHYLLHGRNGVGKSTVLQALAERYVPGIAANLRMLLLGQTHPSQEAAPGLAEIQEASQSVLEYVTRSDAKRERALKDHSRLSQAFEKNADSDVTCTVVRQIQLERARNDEREAHLIAERRSGARGAKAREVLLQKERHLEDAKRRLETPVDPEATDLDMKTGLEMLEDIRADLNVMSVDTTEGRARSVLLGLGFSEKQIADLPSKLSGGWRSRCDLACALIQQFDILMLDEPTNFLDLPAIVWLQRYIENSLIGKTVLIVTHDRDFADAVANELILLRLKPAKTIETFKGNLTEYETEKFRQIRRMTRMSEAQEKKNKHIEGSIQKNLQAAKKKGDDKKLKQAVSRKKKLEERSGIEVSAKGGRFKLSRDLAGFHTSRRADIEIPGFDPPVGLALPEQPSPLRHPGSLVSLENVSLTYPKSGILTLKDINLVIQPGDRIGLAGLNGSGKSTLIKLIMAAFSGGGLQPSKGTITTHSKARCGYYSQHAVEELEAVGKEDTSLTALKHVNAVHPGHIEQELRSILAGFGLRGNTASHVPLASLSGGQRVRVALALALFDSPHLLILDEVTTHLDADTIVALIEELRGWDGALVVATHDRYFMRCVVEREKVNVRTEEESDDSSSEDDEEKAPGVVYRCFKAGLQKLEGGMMQYEALVEKALDKRKA